MTDDELMQAWADVGRRLHGTSLEYRRHGVDWPAPWRARVTATKNERAESRVVGYGHTWQEAVAAALQSEASER